MFLDEIAQILELDGTTKNSYSAYLKGANGIYIQGNVKITYCSTVKISFAINSLQFSVFGENLKIKNLTLDTLAITGLVYGFINESKLKL
ncbi:MAG: hypothetical protein J6C13_01930 [Clostridia bacterium]|nr:hypothetical protein [Clostridia bacterium]